MNFYPHYLGDYARDTKGLSLIEHGAYRVLLDQCYATEKPLPGALADLYRIAGAMTPAERKAVDKVAEKFFPLNGAGSRHNARADIEIAKVHAYADAQSMRAHKRWHSLGISGGNAVAMPPHMPNASGGNAVAMPPHMPNASRSDANHNHNQRKTTTPLPPSGAFLNFWAAWPKHHRKQAQGKCWECWRKGDFDLIAEKIVAHVEASKISPDWLKDAGEYIQAPLVYLKQRRWEGAEQSEQQLRVAMP